MEQGLEAPALHRAECEDRLRATAAEGASEQGERKGEKARFAVNGKAGNGRNGDARPREHGIRPGDRSCRRREGFEG